MTLTWGEGAALVTGGTGGIGGAVVRSLSAAGLPVGLTWHGNREAAERLVRECGGPERAAAWPLSGAGAAEAESVVARAIEALGPLRCLVCCAGIPQTSAFGLMEEAAWRAILETNLAAVLSVARAAVMEVNRTGRGRIVLISSVSGLRGTRGHAVYAASKAALDGFARALSKECAGFGTTVNSVAPGWIDTPMLDGLPERKRQELERSIPAGRLGRPEEVAALVTYLLSDQAAYITGQTLVLDGGLTT